MSSVLDAATRLATSAASQRRPDPPRANVAGNIIMLSHALPDPRLLTVPARKPGTAPSAHKERRSGQAADLLPGIQQNHRFTGRRTRLQWPRQRVCGRLNTSKQELPSVAVNGPAVRTHAAPLSSFAKATEDKPRTAAQRFPERMPPPGGIPAQARRAAPFRRLDSSHCCTVHPRLKQKSFLSVRLRHVPPGTSDKKHF